LHAGRFAELLQGHNRESIADGLAGEGIRTRYKIARNGKSIALELPAAAVSVFAAASGHGKTAMLINLALDVCEQYPAKEVHFFTLEESREAVAAKMLNTFSNTQFADSNESAIFAALRGDFSKMSESTEAEFKVKTAQFFDLYGKRLFVHYVETATVEELTEAVRYLNERRPVAAIFCDYVQLLCVENRGRLDRIEELKRVCLALKETANATRLPLVFAAQFNRTVRSEADSHQYTNIGEAGDIERIAALIVGLWNRTFSAEDAKPEPANIMAAKVLKWRGGPVGYTGAWAWDGNRKTIESETFGPAKNTHFNISKS